MNISDSGVWQFWMTEPLAVWLCRHCGQQWVCKREHLPKKCPYCGEEE